MASPQLLDEYDIIIAGGGTAAGVIFGRLAAADPSLRILMLEMGPTTKDDLAHIQPARSLSHLNPDSKTVKQVVGKPSDYLNGRELTVQCGQCVGGGSSVGLLCYVQPAASDYDDWENMHNNPGWSFKDLLPLIRKGENYQVAPGEPSHGYDGPLKVSYRGLGTNVGDEYLATISQYNKTRATVGDASCTPTLNHVEIIIAQSGLTERPVVGPMWPTATFILHWINLGTYTCSPAVRNGKATGVEYELKSKVSSNTHSTSRTVRATKLVVVSSGALGSPAILERSGIGSKEILGQLNIGKVVDLPGVGENFVDHPLIFLPFRAKDDAETLGGIIRGDHGEYDKWSARWQDDGRGLMASNGVDGILRYRPSEQEVLAIGREFTERWTSFYASAPDKPVILAGLLSGYIGRSPQDAGQKVYSTGAYATHPVGMGSVHITSADDVYAPLDFDTGILSRQEDLAVMRYSWKICREHGRRMSYYRGEYAPDYPKFPDGSAAAVSPDHTMPVPTDAPDVVYTEEDDKAIDDLLKANILSTWNSLGTCAMKPKDRGGVVDSRLNVYGVHNLKVADMSICPSVVGANTFSAAVLVGEKAAMIIGEELGIAKV